MKIALLIITLVTLMTTTVRAADLITYQGKLTNAQGAALADGTYRIGIRIWDVPTGGTVPLWARKYDAPVVGGHFSLMVGAQGIDWSVPAPLTASLKLAVSGTDRYVEITVMSDANGTEKPEAQWQVLNPRQQLGAVPYAMNGVPPGSMIAFAGTVIPDGWVLCDGRALSRTQYPALFQAIGTTYGGGNTPNFILPDTRGLVMRGTGSQTLNGRTKAGPALGATQEDQMQKMTGALRNRSTDSGSLINVDTPGVFQVTIGSVASPAVARHATATGTQTISFDSATSPGARTSSATDGETRVSALGVNYIIKY